MLGDEHKPSAWGHRSWVEHSPASVASVALNTFFAAALAGFDSLKDDLRVRLGDFENNNVGGPISCERPFPLHG